jgi:UDP-N-acetylglucosamine/UDP-N-acetyl-alpha-D-glucosaminouronate 4-epimerase
MRVLVTGGGGFIGCHLAEPLCLDGHDVRVLDNFSTGRRDSLRYLADEVELVEGDIQSYERVHRAVRDRDYYVFHEAALPSVPRSVQDPLTSNATNFIGTLNTLLAARNAGVRRVVFASSSSVYGASPGLPKREELPPMPIWPYAVSKLACEGYCRTFTSVYGLETVALRYFNVFGPRQDPTSHDAVAIPRFITACMTGTSPVVFGDGEQSRDFTYVGNVVEANLLAMTADGAAGNVYNIACGERVTINRLLRELERLTGREIAVEYAPPRAGDVRHSLADLTRAEADLNYRPLIGLRDGLRLTLAAYEQQRDGTGASLTVH